MKTYIHLFTWTFLLFFKATDASDRDVWEKRIIEAACQRNSKLQFCKTPKNNAIDENHNSSPEPQKDEPVEMEKEINDFQFKSDSISDSAVKEQCLKAQNIASKYCDGRNAQNAIESAKCRAYFRDCARYIPQTDPLYNIAKSYSSQVGINAWQFNVNGIPYYLINEEGGIGAGQMLNVPFGSWGGGYEGHVGVRDYWSQYQQAGANWYDGQYGYQSGWSVPLVQSLGVEGNGGTRVAVPLKSHDFGKIGVDNGYGVGGYYSGNNHVGVDWKEGQVNNLLGINIPFAGVGYNFGQAVSFPSINTFAGKYVQP